MACIRVIGRPTAKVVRALQPDGTRDDTAAETSITA